MKHEELIDFTQKYWRQTIFQFTSLHCPVKSGASGSGTSLSHSRRKEHFPVFSGSIREAKTRKSVF